MKKILPPLKPGLVSQFAERILIDGLMVARLGRVDAFKLRERKSRYVLGSTKYIRQLQIVPRNEGTFLA